MSLRIAGRAQVRDGGPELLRRRIDDKVTDHRAKHAAGDGDDDPRQDGTEDAAEPDREAHVPGQECRDLLRDALQVVAGDEEVLRARHTVDEADGEVEAVRVFEHTGEPFCCRVLRRLPAGHLGGRTFGQPLLHERHRVLREVCRACSCVVRLIRHAHDCIPRC